MWSLDSIFLASETEYTLYSNVKSYLFILEKKIYIWNL